MDKTTKLLGGWGYVAAIAFGIFSIFLGPLGTMLSLAGVVLVVVAFFRAASQYDLPDMRTHVIIAVVFGAIAVVIFLIMVGVSLAALFVHQEGMGLAAFGGGMIAGGLITWILWIVSSWFWYKASASLGDASDQGLFKTGGLLMFIGAITLVVFGLGAIVSLVGKILQVVAFFTTPEPEPQGPSAPPA